MRVRVTARALPGGLLLGGSPRVLRKVDEGQLAELARDGVVTGRLAALARSLVSAGLADAATSATSWTAQDVTAVIPVKDDAVRVIAAVAAAAGVAEVVVVDDGSTDGTGDAARRAGATVLRHETPQGPAAARDAGLRQARTPLVLFLDADACAEPGWLEPLLAALEDPKVLVAAPRVLGLQEQGGGLLERYERAQSPLDRGELPRLVGVGRDIAFVPAVALLARREELLALGGFDATMRVGEDVDLCARASRAGWLIRYEPAAVVRHDHRTSWRAFVRRRFQYGTSGAVLATTHPDLVAPASPGGWLGAALLVARFPRPRSTALALAVPVLTAARAAGVLAGSGVPTSEAAKLAVRDEVASARRFLGTATRYTGLPVTAALALRSRRARLLLVAGSLALHARDHRARQPELSLGAFIALRTLDEASVSAGLWRSIWEHRTLRPLDPRLRLVPQRDGEGGLVWQEQKRD